MKKSKIVIFLLIILLFSVILYPDSSKQTASSSLKVTIIFPNKENDTTTSISHIPSSILLPSQSHNSSNIEVVDFFYSDGLNLKISNTDTASHNLSLNIKIIDKSNGIIIDTMNYSDIISNSNKSLSIKIKRHSFIEDRSYLVVSEVKENGESIISAVTNIAL